MFLSVSGLLVRESFGSQPRECDDLLTFMLFFWLRGTFKERGTGIVEACSPRSNHRSLLSLVLRDRIFPTPNLSSKDLVWREDSEIRCFQTAGCRWPMTQFIYLLIDWHQRFDVYRKLQQIFLTSLFAYNVFQKDGAVVLIFVGGSRHQRTFWMFFGRGETQPRPQYSRHLSAAINSVGTDTFFTTNRR